MSITLHPDGPLFAYRALRGTGTLTGDPQQELAAEKLQALWVALRDARPVQQGWLQRIGIGRRPEPALPGGLYIYGDVGRGKSMLMDLFFAHAPVEQKRRVHFHAFMQEVHAEIHRWRQLDRSRRDGDDPIPPLAAKVAAQAQLLCFDEFQVADVADAMILGRLFEQFFERRVVVVATSNRPPDDLYKHGLNRPLFLPFIAMLKERLDVLHLAGAVDYRLNRLAGHPVWHVPADAAAAAELDAAFSALTDAAAGEPLDLKVQGRVLRLPLYARGVGRATFDDLCTKAVGPADFLAIAAACHTLVLAGIPALGPEKRNEAKRFVTLIDTLYEAKSKLIASAAAVPEKLYPEGDGAFEFQRTVSRLQEMQSADYWQLPHVADTADDEDEGA
jgi:cell division protein ZapE